MGKSVARSRLFFGARTRKLAAGGAAAALVAGMLVVAGLGVQQAMADAPKPKVTATIVDQPMIAGDDVQLQIGASHEKNSPIGEFNLSFGITLPDDVKVTGYGDLGEPTKSYAAGKTLPGNYSMTPEQCEQLGLEAAATPANACKVPAGKQYLVFENASDLPSGASNNFTLTLRPDASKYDVGAKIPFSVNAATSNDARLLPSIPGTTSKSLSASHTSGIGIADGDINIEALQLTKDVDLPEDELLRGVHANQAVYTLTVKHTGEGDVKNVTVTDYLPAHLEYLGSGASDNTRNANGNPGALEEYTGSGPLNVSAELVGWVPEQSVETVKLSADEAEAAGLGTNAGGVYTKVVWRLADLLKGANGSVAQAPAMAERGTPGEVTIKYRAGVPLFANTLDFVGDAPASDSLQQAANLDNNTGVSTRQGQDGDPWVGGSQRNTAVASGEYTLKNVVEGEDPVVKSFANGSGSVEVLDVRLLKDVKNGNFQQGNIAEYSLHVQASEYVDATFGEGQAAPRNRLVDDMGDGLCPVFPLDVPITPGASDKQGPNGSPLPNLVIGDPNLGSTDPGNKYQQELEAWNTALGDARADCAFLATHTGAAFSAESNGTTAPPASPGTLSGIGYNPDNGHFYLDFDIADLAANQSVQLNYTAVQNSNYADSTGGTSSGDRVYNSAEVLMTTNPTGATADVTNSKGTGVGDELRAYDGSDATLIATLTNLTKDVLPRSVGTKTVANITDPDLAWSADEAPEPFMAGDEVWYRITLDPPAKADVRNPTLADMVPPGVDIKLVDGKLSPDSYVVVPPTVLNSLDGCSPQNAADWLSTFVGQPVVSGKLITWNLGNAACVTGNKSGIRYLPADAEITIYLKGTVVGASDVGSNDLTQNLVKYQQLSRDGDSKDTVVEFMRDSAGISIVEVPTLIKGIESNTFAGLERPEGYVGEATYPAGTPGTAPNGFNSNTDGQFVTQGDDVTFRIDVTLPESDPESVGTSTGYEIWDALPVSMRMADLAGTGNTGNHQAVMVLDGVDLAPSIPPTSIEFVAYDPGAPGRAALGVRSDYDNRTIVVWKLDTQFLNSKRAVVAPEEAAVQRGFSLKYTVNVPEGKTGATLQQDYINTASIVQYEGQGHGNGTPGNAGNTVVVPFGDGTLRANTEATLKTLNGFAVPVEGTIDSSNVVVPNAFMNKRVVSTEVGSTTATAAPEGTVGVNNIDSNGNSQTQIVQGELVTYEYSVQVPANTAVKNGVLSDNGALALGNTSVPYTVVGDAKFFKDGTALDTCPTDFSCLTTEGAKRGVLKFPAEYVNDTNRAQTFSVHLTVWVDDADATNADTTPNLPHNPSADVKNTATFTSNSATGNANDTLTDRANVQYVEPDIKVAKAAMHDSTTVTAGEVITYEIALTNSADRPASYDNKIVDTVPAGLEIDVTELKRAYPSVELSDETNLAKGEGGTITWRASEVAALAKVLGGAKVTVTYLATVIETAGGSETFKNNVKATGFTLPDPIVSGGASTDKRRGDREAKNSATVTAVGSTLTKQVKLPSATDYSDAVSAPIGQTVNYAVSVVLNKQINYFDARVVDQLPAGAKIDASSIVVKVDGVVTNDWKLQNVVDNKLVWLYVPTDGHITPGTADRVLTFNYDVLLSDEVPFKTNALTNTAAFSWGIKAGAEETDRKSIPDSATVNVLNPSVKLVKTVDGQQSVQRNPDATLPYKIAVTNPGSTPAFNVKVVDCVPAGVVVDDSTISHGGSLSSLTAECGGGAITWNLAGPLVHTDGSSDLGSKKIDLTYEAKFAHSNNLLANSATGLGHNVDNVVDVTQFESFETDGRTFNPGTPASGDTPAQPRISSFATAVPLFPHVTLAKSVANGNVAYANKPFSWNLTLVNTGRGDAQTLQVTDVLPKNWTYDAGSALIKNGTGAQVALGNPTVTPGTGADSGKSVLTWSLGAVKPGVAAISGSAAGSNAAARTAVITFTATPNDEALNDSGVGMTVNHTNVLRGVATDTTGATRNKSATKFVGNDANAIAHIASADLSITKVGATSPIHAGTTATGWTITVTNNGPDTAEGSITVTDTTSALPAGITVSSVGGDGWRCEAPVRDADTGATSFECERTNPAESLANGVSFPVIDVSVTVAADQASVAANIITNTADVVPGKTHDPKVSNNTSTDDIIIDNLADLTIAKTISGPAPVNVGDSIAWQVSAWNAGPSASRGTSENPISFTDAVPAGVTGVTATSNADWVATLANGDAIPAEGVGAGTVIKWTYQHAQMPKLPAKPAPVSLSGTVLTSHTGALSNTATVVPGVTPEPTTDPLTNTSTVTVTPESEAVLATTKTRVVADGNGGWRPAGEGDGFIAGTDISYLMTITNLGPADARDVKVVDEVPAGLSYSTHENVSGTWTRASGGTTSTGANNTWDTFTLSGTQTASDDLQFVVTYTTLPTMPASFLNCIEATTSNWKIADAQKLSRACNDSASTRVVDLGIVKTHTGAGPFVAGTVVPYAITVTNHGPSASAGPIVISDGLPAGLSYVAETATVSVAGGASYAAEPTFTEADTGKRLPTWSVPISVDTVLEPGETIVVTLDALINPSIRGAVKLPNTATVLGPENEPPVTTPGVYPNTSTDEIAVITESVMTIVKDVEAGPWLAGTNVTYTLTVSNNGPSEAPASVQDVLPAGLSFVDVTGAGWECDSADGVPTGACAYTSNDGLHPVGESTITVVAHIASNVQPTAVLPAAGLVNTATLTWSDSGGSYTDDDTAEIRITTDADLGIVKDIIDGAEGEVIADADATAIAGGTLWYRLVVSNYGVSDASGELVVTDVLPEGITVPTNLTSLGQWTVVAEDVDADSNRQTVTFTLDADLVAGTGATPVNAPVIEFEANVDSAIADSTTLTNSASVTSETTDSNPDNDEDTASVVVTRSADLAVTKTHLSDENGEVHIDEPLDFTIQVVNNGPSAASGITVTDTIPAGLEVVSELGEVLDGDGVPTGWIIESITLVDEADPLAGAVIVASYDGTLGVTAEDSAASPLTITTVPRESALGTDPNRAAVAGNEVDPELTNNEAIDPIKVRPRVTLVTEKTAVGAFQVGKVGEYLISVENLGPHGDPGPIQVVDVLPEGLAFQSSPDLPSGVDFEREGDTITWTIVDGLKVDEKIELRLLVNVGQAAFPSVSNTVTVDSLAEKTPESVFTDSATVSVAPVDPLVVTGGDIAAGMLAALALMMLLGGVTYSLGRRRQGASHAA